MDTTLESEKQLRREVGQLAFSSAAQVEGYEIHAGVTQGPALNNPAVQLSGRADGAISEDGQIIGTYLHGLFDHTDASKALLKWAGLKQAQRIDYCARQDVDIERLADAIEAHLDLNRVFELVGMAQADKKLS